MTGVPNPPAAMTTPSAGTNFGARALLDHDAPGFFPDDHQALNFRPGHDPGSLGFGLAEKNPAVPFDPKGAPQHAPAAVAAAFETSHLRRRERIEAELPAGIEKADRLRAPAGLMGG